jgi:GR25 family glycosyltransferase involved in LPS biosynthesis
MHVFVINLDRDADRMALMAAHLSAMDMRFERWPATDGTTLDYEQEGRDGIVIRDFGPWALREAACGVSHIRLWRHIVERRLPFAVILEDDARLRWAVPFDTRDWELPADADVVLLNKRALAGTVRHEGGFFSYADVVGGAGTEGYVVSLAGAERLLAITQPLKDPLDFQIYAHLASVRRSDRHPFFWALPRNPGADDISLTAYRAVPSLVEHAPGASSIGNYRHPRARFYCRLLLGINFDSEYRYNTGHIEVSLAPPVASPKTFSGVKSDDWDLDPTANGFACGVDISHCREEMAEPVTRILADNGVNTVRLSIWVDDQSTMNLARGLRLARVASAAGLRLYLALHYSDTWGDPGRQRNQRSGGHSEFAILWTLFDRTRGMWLPRSAGRACHRRSSKSATRLLTECCGPRTARTSVAAADCTASSFARAGAWTISGSFSRSC